MRAVRLTGPRTLAFSEEPRPLPRQGERLVRVTAVGICGSDLHWFEESGIGDARLDRPLVLGHEFAGIVEANGNSARLEDDARAGRASRSVDLVAVDPAVVCGRCAFCREGNPNFCENIRFAGHGVQDGGLQEYLAWPEECLFPVPSDLTPEDAAMLEPLGVAIHAVDLGKVGPGMTVSVLGCGSIGLLVAQVARAAGAARLFGTEILPHRLEAAEALGIEPVAASDGAEAAVIHRRTGGRGVDVVFECAGDDRAVGVAMEVARPGARVVLAGIPSDDRTTFSASLARRKGLTIKLVRRMKHTYPRAIALVTAGMVDVRSLVTHRFPLSEAPEAFAVAARREGVKVVVISES